MIYTLGDDSCFKYFLIEAVIFFIFKILWFARDTKRFLETSNFNLSFHFSKYLTKKSFLLVPDNDPHVFLHCLIRNLKKET